MITISNFHVIFIFYNYTSTVLSKTWPGQPTIMKNKWLMGDNSLSM